MIKLMSLNIWGYEDWSNRKNNLENLMESKQPDIIALQEVRLLHDSTSQIAQSSFISKVSKLPYSIFAPTYRREDPNTDVSHGLAFYSKYPILSVEIYHLKQGLDFHEKCSVLLVSLKIDGRTIEFCNVHFGNTDKESDLHIRELIQVLHHRKSSPIIMGDFNIFNIDTYLDKKLLVEYAASSQYLDYISIPKNNGRLDYILAPKEKYTISSVQCPETYVSDHRALFAEIDFNE
jgi:endonuclease/exonuclease/phosphatase family metal-dependent hydrolase